MERFHPSQIDWTGFVNREPTSVTQLWPPSSSSESRETTPDRSTLPTSTATAASDWQTITDPSDLSLTSPDLYLDHVRSIKSLRSFVKKEIGLNAIDHRMSQPVFKETAASTRTAINPEAIDLERWTRERVRRLNHSNQAATTQYRNHDTNGAENQPTTIKPATKPGRISMWKEKCLNRCDNLKEAAKAVVSEIHKCFRKLSGRT